MELECVFFSVTPTLISRSRITLLLTSSSLARSLIRTFCSIPPYFLRIVPSVYALIASPRCKFADPRLDRVPAAPKVHARLQRTARTRILTLFTGQLFVRHILVCYSRPLVGGDFRHIRIGSILHAVHYLGLEVLTFVNQLFHRLGGSFWLGGQPFVVSRLNLGLGHDAGVLCNLFFFRNFFRSIFQN